jgi:hypothetical protein
LGSGRVDGAFSKYSWYSLGLKTVVTVSRSQSQTFQKSYCGQSERRRRRDVSPYGRPARADAHTMGLARVKYIVFAMQMRLHKSEGTSLGILSSLIAL